MAENARIGGRTGDGAGNLRKERTFQAGARLRRFNPWRRAVSESLEDLIAYVVTTVVDDSLREGRWKRRPRADGFPTLARQVEAVIADLAHLHVAREDRPDELVVSRYKGFLGHSRYCCGGVETRALPRVLDALEASGFIRQTRGLPRYVARQDGPAGDDGEEHSEGLPPKASTLRAAPALLAAFQRLRLSANDVAADDGRELVALTGRQIPGGYRELIEYRDTCHTRALRAEMEAINAWLASFAVTLEGDPRPAGAWRRPLWRTFIYEGGAKNPLGTPDVFSLGGRLYGGFWQTLPRARRGRLRIDGEPVGIVDLGQMPPRLESATAASALLACKAHGVRALPMHHAILAGRADVERAGAILRDVFRAQAGADANVSCHRHDLADIPYDRCGGA